MFCAVEIRKKSNFFRWEVGVIFVKFICSISQVIRQESFRFFGWILSFFLWLFYIQCYLVLSLLPLMFLAELIEEAFWKSVVPIVFLVTFCIRKAVLSLYFIDEYLVTKVFRLSLQIFVKYDGSVWSFQWELFSPIFFRKQTLFY